MQPQKRPIRVLVFTLQYAPDFGPSAPIFTALCEDLQQDGYEVTVVTSFPHYAGSEKWYPHPKKLFTKEERNGVQIIRSYVYNVPKSALWGRLFYHGSYNILAAIIGLHIGADIVLADAPTLESGLPLMIRSVVLRVPFIYIVHDIYPDVLFRLGVVRNEKLIKLIDRVEKFFYQKSVQTTVLSEGFKQNLARKGVAEDKISIIPVCVDTDLIKPLERKNELRECWEIEDQFVVLYAGNIGFSQGLEIIVEAARILRDDPKITFVVVGEGAKKEHLQAMIEDYGLANVKIFPFQPREKVPLIYAIADVCLVSLKRDIVVESVPSKTYSILSSGRPLIATVDPDTETGRLIGEAQCGLCVEPENAKALSDAIIKLYKDDDLRTAMGKRGRDFVIERYSRPVVSNQYSSLIQRFAKRAS
jgi:colanic acid biosynthesis glycosyl transferase WcaI